MNGLGSISSANLHLLKNQLSQLQREGAGNESVKIKDTDGTLSATATKKSGSFRGRVLTAVHEAKGLFSSKIRNKRDTEKNNARELFEKLTGTKPLQDKKITVVDLQEAIKTAEKNALQADFDQLGTGLFEDQSLDQAESTPSAIDSLKPGLLDLKKGFEDLTETVRQAASNKTEAEEPIYAQVMKPKSVTPQTVTTSFKTEIATSSELPKPQASVAIEAEQNPLAVKTDDQQEARPKTPPPLPPKPTNRPRPDDPQNQ